MECHLLEAKGFKTIEGICLGPTCWIWVWKLIHFYLFWILWVCFPVSAHAYFLLLFIPLVFSIKSIEWIGPTIYDAAFPCVSYLFVRPSVECWVSDLIFKICSLYYADPEAEIENKYSKNWVDYFWLIELEMLKKYCYRTLTSGDEHSDLSGILPDTDHQKSDEQMVTGDFIVYIVVFSGVVSFDDIMTWFLLNSVFEHLTSRGDGHIIRTDNFPQQIWDNPPSRFLGTLNSFLKGCCYTHFMISAY